MSPTGRWESRVLSRVPPDRLRREIEAMEAFGWTLQSSQEVVDQQIYTDSFGTTKTVSQSHYSLHFLRSLDTPNLDKLRAIETEYRAINFSEAPPASPRGRIGCLIAGACLLIVLSVVFVHDVRFAKPDGCGATLHLGLMALVAYGTYEVWKEEPKERRHYESPRDRAGRLMAEARELL